MLFRKLGLVKTFRELKQVLHNLKPQVELSLRNQTNQPHCTHREQIRRPDDKIKDKYPHYGKVNVRQKDADVDL